MHMYILYTIIPYSSRFGFVLTAILYCSCVLLFCVCLVALQAGSVDDLRSFRTRRQPTRRSARSGTIKGPIDPKGMYSLVFYSLKNVQFNFSRMK